MNKPRNAVLEEPSVYPRGVRGDVTGECGTVRWEAKPGALLPPGYKPGTPVQLHGQLDDVLAAFKLLVAEGDRAREVAR